MDELQSLVDSGLSQKEIAKQLGLSVSGVKYHLKKRGISMKVSSNTAPVCKKCGENGLDKFYTRRGGDKYSTYCKSCEIDRSVGRFRYNKKTFIEYKGGRCEKCGYDKCYGALEFHHIDPSQKDPHWNNMRGKPLESVKDELDKCLLVCSNCHREIHYGSE